MPTFRSRATTLIAMLLAMAAPLFAQPATGEIAGTVSSAETGKYLANVRVHVEGTGIATLTDGTGDYVLRGVPAGTAQVIVSSAGTANQTASVSVQPGALAHQDFSVTLSGHEPSAGKVLKLDPYSVSATVLNARAVSLDEQRYSPNIKNVVSADEFGDIGEGNISEFLKFVPGVAIDYSANVGAGVSIRGFPASTTLITVDGADVPSAGIASNQVPTNENATRTVTLDALRLNNISRIEVTKSPTPDLPANSMGGSVNVISKNAFELAHPVFTLKAFTTFNSRGFGTTRLNKRTGSRPELSARPVQPGFKFSFEDPVNKNFGISFSGSSFIRNYAYRSASTSWNLNGTNAVLGGATIDAEEQLYKSTDASLNAEWRLSPHSIFKLGGLYVATTTYISDNKLTALFGDNPTGGATYVHGTSATGSGEMANPLSAQVNGKTYELTGDYRYKTENWIIHASGFTSRNTANQQDISKGFFNRVDLELPNLIVSGEDIGGGMPNSSLPRNISATDAAGHPVDIMDGGAYAMSRAISRPMNTVDVKSGAKFDVSRFLGPLLTLKAGGAYNFEARDTINWFNRWDFQPTVAGGSTAGDFNLTIPAYSATAQNYYPGQQAQWVSLAKIYQLFQQHPEYFKHNDANSYSQTVRYSPRLVESVKAAYVRADLKLLHGRLWLVGGARYERTDDRGDGPLQNQYAIYQHDANGKLVYDANGKLIPLTKDPFEKAKLQWTYRGEHTRRHYGDYYPSFNATFNITQDLLIRGAYAKTLGRPEMQDIIPGTFITDPSAPQQNRKITVVNSGLLPWTCNGYDLSLEYYGRKWGVASVGVFQKDIRNFFGGTVVPASDALLQQLDIPVDYPGEYDTYRVYTTENVPGNVRIRGLELSYQNSFAPLGRWFKNFQGFANATFLQLNGSNEADFSGYWPKTFNFGVSYTTPQLLVQLNWNIKPANPLEPRGNDPTVPISWQSGRKVLSADVEYRMTKHLFLYFTADNLTDSPDVTYYYGSLTPAYARNAGVSAYGTDFTLGVKGTF